MDKVTLYINSGICKCGCSWEDHHLGMIVNKKTWDAIVAFLKENFPDKKWYSEGPTGIVEHSYPMYIPQECDHYGCNELSGMKYNEKTDEYEDHCHGYEDILGPLGEVEY